MKELITVKYGNIGLALAIACFSTQTAWADETVTESSKATEASTAESSTVESSTAGSTAGGATSTEDRSTFIQGSVRTAALRTMDGLLSIETASKILQSSATELMKEVTRKETVVVRGPNYIGNGIVIPAIGDPSGTMQMGKLPARRKKLESFLGSSEDSYNALESQVHALIIGPEAPPDLHNLWAGMRSTLAAAKENITQLHDLIGEKKLDDKQIGRAALKVYDSMTALNKVREQMLEIVKTEELHQK